MSLELGTPVNMNMSSSQLPDSSQPVAPAPVTTPEASKEDSRIASKFNALTQKEKAALHRLQAATTKEKEVLAKEELLRTREDKVREFETVRSQNPMKALEMLGLTYQQLTDLMLNNGAPTAEFKVSQIEKNFEDYKKTQEQRDADNLARQQEDAKKSEEEVITNFKTEIKDFIETNKTKYPLIDIYQQDQLIFDTIEEQYNTTGKIMSITEATDRVEAYLEREAEKALAVEKIKAKVLPQPQAENKQVSSWGQKPTKTLTNTMTSTSSSKPKFLSEQERINRAYARLSGSQTL